MEMNCYCDHVLALDDSNFGEEITYMINFEKEIFISFIKGDADEMICHKTLEELKDYIKTYPWDTTDELIDQTTSADALRQLRKTKKAIQNFLETLEDIEPPSHTSD